MEKKNWIDGIDDMEEEVRQERFRFRGDSEDDSEEEEESEEEAGECPEDDPVGTDTESEGEMETPEIRKDLRKTKDAGKATGEDAESPKESADVRRDADKPDATIEELKNDLALARADLYNYRQRVERERIQKMKLIGEDRTAEFIPVLDNLDRALLVPGDVSAKDVLLGVRMVQRQFLSVMENAGITIIPTEGCAFDPRWHNAVETELVDDPERDGMVLHELTRGYKTQDRVVRAANVRVGKLKSGENDGDIGEIEDDGNDNE
ncbi:MAG: nucleotide exchange factor GrpE [Synergistaceae bacterium]|jgi:molecular chaperone GrpE|nr:nucleotide exchange factor GrpE [Synergistaceae bacterium]